MKKSLMIITILIALMLLCISIVPTKVYAENATGVQTPKQIEEAKKTQEDVLKEYQDKYESEAYGLTAYILHIVQIYSIPLCFLGIVISFIYKVVIGKRNLENAEKGLGLTIAIVTITIICQVLPLVFAVVVKIGRE